MSLSYKVLELLKKHHAARSNNGVVGNIGTKIPITPKITDNTPKNTNIIFINEVLNISTLHRTSRVFLIFR